MLDKQALESWKLDLQGESQTADRELKQAEGKAKRLHKMLEAIEILIAAQE